MQYAAIKVAYLSWSQNLTAPAMMIQISPISFYPSLRYILSLAMVHKITHVRFNGDEYSDDKLAFHGLKTIPSENGTIPR